MSDTSKHVAAFVGRRFRVPVNHGIQCSTLYCRAVNAEQAQLIVSLHCANSDISARWIGPVELAYDQNGRIDCDFSSANEYRAALSKAGG